MDVRELKEKFFEILAPESSFYLTALVYGVSAGLLTLAVPISAQALVNTVSFGVLIQPLVVLGIVLLMLLIFSGVLNALQTYTIELFQRRFYARMSSRMAVQLLDADYMSDPTMNTAELVNRYFDVMTIQKQTSTLIVGGMAILLQTVLGLILLAFYHPYFLIFDLLLLLMLWAVWALYGKKAIATAIAESKAKYTTAQWLEEIAGGAQFFQTLKRRKAAITISDQKIENYLDKRRKHFRHLFLQMILLLGIYALMSALILGLGGLLVVKGQLSLGQLVAAELVVTIILAGLSKSGKYLESFYDLCGGIDKVSHVLEIPQHSWSNQIPSEAHVFRELGFKNVTFSAFGHKVLLNISLPSGSLSYFFAHQKCTLDLFVQGFSGEIKPVNGSITWGDVDFADISALWVREHMAIIRRPYLMNGTLKENLLAGVPEEQIPASHFNNAMKISGLDKVCDTEELGPQSRIAVSGYPFSDSQLIQVELARAILAAPEIFIFLHSFSSLPSAVKKNILKWAKQESITVLVLSGRRDQLEGFENYYLLEENGTQRFDSSSELVAAAGES